MIALITVTLFYLIFDQVHGYGPALEFDLPKESGNAYVGQLFKHESSVKLSPLLRAFTNPAVSRSNKICGFHPIVKDDYQFPFEVDLKDANRGIGEIRLRNDAPVDFTQNRMYTFQIEAYDCDSPPNYSERVLVNINIRAEEELRFTETVYNFSVPMYSGVGSICGKVTVLHESSSSAIDDKSRQCGYSLLSGTMVPFTVDSHGVIRTREFLTSASPRSYMFPVQYKDCGNVGVEVATAIVNVRVIESNCQPKWTGLPSSLFYSANEPQPKRLLWPLNYHLDMCGMTCDSRESKVYTQVLLRHANPSAALTTASPSFCRHDPRSLHEQRKLCNIDSGTIVDLLPDPQHTSWRLDTSKLLAAASAASDRNEKVLPSNIFERDFTLSFWLQREPKGNDDHETILCSQEDTVAVGRALWISLKGCRVMVQMTTRDPESAPSLTKKLFSTYFFPELPSSVCPNGTRYNNAGEPIDKGNPLAWHHYSISISFEPETADISASSLLVDGELVGTLEAFSKPIYFERQPKEFFTQFITVGTCYDPSIPSAQQSLNGTLAGLTLLLGRNEDQSVSRCLAECGETLLIPRANRLITDDVTVLLNNDNIEIETVTAKEAAELISNVAYVKPWPFSTQLSYDPNGSKDRVIEITTVVRCGARELSNVSTAIIPLILDESIAEPLNDTAEALYSNWVPQNERIIPPSPLAAVSQDEQQQPQPTIVLAVIGEETVRADIPVLEPGITMFPRLEFTFTNVPSKMNSAARSAAMFVFDQCLVMPVDGGSLDSDGGERIIWPAGRAFELGVSVEATKERILMKGRKTANQYASLLRGLRYWPPVEIDKRSNDKDLVSGLLLERRFQLVCSCNSAGFNTNPFTVKILLSSSLVANEVQAGKNVVFSDNSRNPLSGYDYADDDYDEDYNDDSLSGNDPGWSGSIQWPLVANTYQGMNPSARYDSSLERAQFAHSNKEIRSAKTLSLQDKDTAHISEGSKASTLGLAIGLGVTCIAVMVIIAAFLVSKSNGFHQGRLSFFRRGDRKTVGRLQFRPEARLNVIENPIEQLEGGKLNWQPPIATPAPTLSEGLPGVHVPYGAHDDQFDAETRSFNGLFEEDDIIDEAGPSGDEAAAALEDVDDFDDGEVGVMSQHMETRTSVDAHHVRGDEEDESDDGEDTSFSVGPNHLDYVTLPPLRREFNPNV